MVLASPLLSVIVLGPRSARAGPDDRDG